MIKVYVRLNEAMDVHQGPNHFTLPAGVETVVWEGADYSAEAEYAANVLAAWARQANTVSARIERS